MLAEFLAAIAALYLTMSVCRSVRNEFKSVRNEFKSVRNEFHAYDRIFTKIIDVITIDNVYLQLLLLLLLLFIDNIIVSQVFLKIIRANSNNNKLVEIKINVPGKELFAKKKCQSFEEATDEAVAALRRQINKHKGKLLEKS